MKDMDITIVRKLREAGFPQKHKFFACLRCGDGICPCGATELGDLHTPSLSELIEACGETFDTLSQDDDPETHWAAFGGSIWNKRYEGVGSTREDAVAKLWLALNQK
jgi:hypothetical protein